jgi:hypothetical protein
MVITFNAGATAWVNGTLKVIIPPGWSPPSAGSGNDGFYIISVLNGSISGSSKSGQVITVNVSSLASGAGVITLTYGATSKVAAQPLPGTAVFNIESNPTGTVTYPIIGPPQVTVIAPTITATQTFSFTPTSTVTQTPSISPTNTVSPTAIIGEGGMTISPGSVSTGSSGNTLVLNYTSGPSVWATPPGFGALKVSIPPGWPAPSTVTTDAGYFTVGLTSGNLDGRNVNGMDIELFVDSLAPAQQIAIIYGSKSGGGPGVTAPASAGNYIFNVESSRDGITTYPIAAMPSVNVAAPTGTATSTITATSSITMTYTSTPNATPIKPSGITSQLSGNNVILKWNTAAATDYYKVYFATGAAGRLNPFPSGWTMVATVLPTPVASSFIHTPGALDYCFYAVTGVNGAGEGGSSSLVSRIMLTLSSGSVYRQSLPYSSKYTKASDIVADIEGNTFTAAKINQMMLWNPNTQSNVVYLFANGQWKGVNWLVDEGTHSSNAISFVTLSSFIWYITGTDVAVPIFFNYNTGLSDANKKSLPYGNIYTKSSQVVTDIEGNTNTGNNINTIMKWVPGTNSYIVRYFTEGKWKGPDFDLYPGDMIDVLINQSFTWTPKLVMTPAP